MATQVEANTAIYSGTSEDRFKYTMYWYVMREVRVHTRTAMTRERESGNLARLFFPEALL